MKPRPPYRQARRPLARRRRGPPDNSRGYRQLALVASVRLEALRVVGLASSVRIDVPTSYRVFILETVTYTETEYPGGLWAAPADGFYLVRVVMDAGVWRDHPCEVLRPVLIQDGTPAQSPPIIAAPTVRAVDGGVWVAWRYQRQYGQQDPRVFYVWTGAAHPVSMAGPAQATVPVESEGIYGVFIASGGPVAVVVASP